MMMIIYDNDNLIMIIIIMIMVIITIIIFFKIICKTLFIDLKKKLDYLQIQEYEY